MGSPIDQQPDEYDDDDDDIDVCLGCGRYYGSINHSGLVHWNPEDGVAPQLCMKCWRKEGHPLPDLSHLI